MSSDAASNGRLLILEFLRSIPTTVDAVGSNQIEQKALVRMGQGRKD
jgi:hypothetical protein